MAALRNAQAYIGSIQGYGMAISEAPNSILLDVSTAEPIGRRWRWPVHVPIRAPGWAAGCLDGRGLGRSH